jgi:hypothetical protein
VQIELDETEWHTLRLVFEDYLPQLRREVANTESVEFRHELVRREDVCEHLLDLLQQAEV